MHSLHLYEKNVINVILKKHALNYYCMALCALSLLDSLFLWKCSQWERAKLLAGINTLRPFSYASLERCHFSLESMPVLWQFPGFTRSQKLLVGVSSLTWWVIDCQKLDCQLTALRQGKWYGHIDTVDSRALNKFQVIQHSDKWVRTKTSWSCDWIKSK